MISKKEVKNIADLARVGINDEEINNFSQDLSSILDWMEQLNEVDVAGVEPTAHITGLENRIREDKESDFENKKGIVKLFPEEKNNYNKVKSVL